MNLQVPEGLWISVSLQHPGFHRQLSFQTDSVTTLHRHCESSGLGAASYIALLLEIPPSLFADPFELENLHALEPYLHPETRVFGQVDLELCVASYAASLWRRRRPFWRCPQRHACVNDEPLMLVRPVLVCMSWGGGGGGAWQCRAVRTLTVLSAMCRPESASHWTLAAAKLMLPPPASADCPQKLNFSLPLHAKYPTPGHFGSEPRTLPSLRVLWAGAGAVDAAHRDVFRVVALSGFSGI